MSTIEVLNLLTTVFLIAALILTGASIANAVRARRYLEDATRDLQAALDEARRWRE